jgi:hypothetical protein
VMRAALRKVSGEAAAVLVGDAELNINDPHSMRSHRMSPFRYLAQRTYCRLRTRRRSEQNAYQPRHPHGETA